MRLFTTFVLWLVVAQGAVFAEDASPEARFQKAWYLETGENEYAAALEVYEGLAADDSLERPLRARALYRAGVCLRKLGQHPQALRTYQRVLKEFPDESFVVAAARREVEGKPKEEAKLREEVGRVVAEWTPRGSRQRRGPPSGRRRLEELGPRASRFVLDYLQETPPSDENAEVREELAETVVRLAADDPALRFQVSAVLEDGNNDVRATLLSKMDHLWLAKFR
jgi:tetratricopeptide (TPR) repeat protein